MTTGAPAVLKIIMITFQDLGHLGRGIITMKIIIPNKSMIIMINNNNDDDNNHNDHFSRSRAPGQRNNVRDGAVLANKKRVIHFVMIFYSFRFIPDLNLMLMSVMFVIILFLKLLFCQFWIIGYVQVCNYFFLLIAYVLMSGVDFNILLLFLQ